MTKRTLCMLAITISLLFPTLSEATAAPVHLCVAASMTDAVKALTADFNKSHSDITIVANFASSGALAKQIEQGAPADIYISANQKWMNYLQDKQLIAADSRRTFGYNKLVFVGRSELKPLTLTDVVKLNMIALGTPESVPAGQYAKQALTAGGQWEELAANNKLMMTKDVRQALIYADRGEVDGAFVYRTDALLAKKAEILFTVADNLYDRVAYPIALTLSGAENDAAKLLFDYLQTPQAIAIITGFGFEPAH